MHRLIYTIRVVLICCFVCLLNACAARKMIPVGEIPVAELPSASGIAQTRGFVDQHVNENGYKFLKDPKAEKRIKGIVARLSQAAGVPGGTYPTYIVDAGEEVNAMAVNGNTMVVYKALLDKFQTDEQVAVVVGHEIAHMLCKHHADKGTEERTSAVQVGSTLLGLAASIGASIAGVGAGAADLAGNVTEGVTGVVGMGAFALSYDRAMEQEADQVGLMIMAKAGYNPETAVYVWEHAEELLGDTNKFSFLSTHPSSSARVDELKAVMPVALQYYQPGAGSSPATSSRAKR